MMLYMCGKSTVAMVFILVAVVNALPNSKWDHTQYRRNDLFAARDEEVDACVKSQTTIETSSCATVTEMMGEKYYRVRICTADPEDSPNKVCLGTRVNPCCPNANFSLGNLVSSTKVSVAGEDVTVAYYLTQDPTEGAGICFRLDDAHQSSETCSLSRSVDFPCFPPCFPITTTCFNNTLSGDCSSCDGNICQCKTGYLPPDCCKCDTTNFYLPDCKQCNASLKPDGTCAEGALEPDCCECDTTGNATHAFYKNKDDECIPFCKSNCAVIGSSGCATCKTGFMTEPECCQCEPDRTEVNGVCKCDANLKPDGTCAEGALEPDCCINTCDKQQRLFLYIDATGSIKYENFCPLIVVLQMLVAAANPSSTSGTKISALLFPDNAKNKPPSPVFDVGTSCFDAMQGLSSLMIDFGVCLDNNRGYDSTLFPSSCGEGTSAVKGLREIYNIASSTMSSTESAVLMLTDGIIMDDAAERTKVLSDLKSAGVNTVIAAGFNEADEDNLKLYTTSDNILIGSNPVKFSIDILNKMEEMNVICKYHANNIIQSLKNAHLLPTFCRCHRKKHITRDMCQRKYPTCGGELSIGLPNLNLPVAGRAKRQDVEAFNQLLMDQDESLTTVEKILE